MKGPLHALSAIAILACLSDPAQAAVAISNFVVTADSLSFDVSGLASADSFPDTSFTMLWFAQPGNTSWINNDSISSYTISGSVDGVAIEDSVERFSELYSFHTALADVAAGIIFADRPLGPDFDFNFVDGINNEINLHIEIISPGKYNPQNIDPSQLVIYWGGWPFENGDATGAVALNAVPEASSFLALAFSGISLAGLRRRPATPAHLSKRDD